MSSVKMFISPMQFLAVALIATAIARVVLVILRRRRFREMQELAQQWRMHYSPRDRFGLAGRVAQEFPLPGASEVRVTNLIYGTEGEFYRFIFCAEYTAGVTRGKQRLRRVATFREPKERAGGARWSPLIVAPEELELINQYKRLREGIEKAKEPSS